MPSDDLRNKLAFVTAVSNPARYRRRYELYHKFAKHIRNDLKHKLITVECQLGDRPFYLTSPSDKDHVQVRAKSELWHKEQLLNIGISRLSPEIEYICWLDADIEFLRPDIIDETIHALQHHSIVQLFQTCVDMGPKGEVMQVHHSFGWCHKTNQPFHPPRGVYPSKQFFHPGYAWAARRDFLDKTGGLFDVGIAGAGDHHMALAAIGKVDHSYPPGVSAGYQRALYDWQEKALAAGEYSLGFVPGTIVHHWHGAKRNRQYQSRWKLLTENGFDPTTDIVRNAQGVWELRGNKPRLRDGLGNYLTARNEDSLDT